MITWEQKRSFIQGKVGDEMTIFTIRTAGPERFALCTQLPYIQERIFGESVGA